MSKRIWLIAGALMLAGMTGAVALAGPVQDETENKTATVQITATVNDEGDVKVQKTSESSDEGDQKSEKSATKNADKKSADKLRILWDEAAKFQAVESKLPKYWLGIQLKPIEGDLEAFLGSSEGVFVEAVYPDSPALAAKLKRGDVLVAVGDKKLIDPPSLIGEIRELESNDDPKPLALKVLRAGESLTIEITPAARPQDTTPDNNSVTDALSFTLSLDGKSSEEIEQILAGIQPSGEGIQLFRVGVPAMLLPQGKAGDANVQFQGIGTGQKNIQISQTTNGKQLEISIVSEGDSPAKITVKRDGKAEEFTEENLDKLPDDVRDSVKNALKNATITKEGRRIVIQHSAKSGEPSEGKSNPDSKQSEERVIVVAPKIGEFMNQEMAEKYRAMAQEMAERAQQSAQWARNAAAMPAEIQELKAQVDALRAEVKELRTQLKEAKE